MYENCFFRSKLLMKYSKFNDQRNARQMRILFSNYTLIEIFRIRVFRILCNVRLLINQFVKIFRCFDDRNFEKRNFEQIQFV